MKLRIMLWNVRRANDFNKRKDIKSLVKSQRADLVHLQETKIQEISTGLLCSLGMGRFHEWGALNSQGMFEGS